MCVLRDGAGGVGGYEGQQTFVYLKWASHFWLSIQNFIVSLRIFFLFLGGWVVRPGGGGGGPPDPPPAPPVDKQNPVSSPFKRSPGPRA